MNGSLSFVENVVISRHTEAIVPYAATFWKKEESLAQNPGKWEIGEKQFSAWITTGLGANIKFHNHGKPS